MKELVFNQIKCMTKKLNKKIQHVYLPNLSTGAGYDTRSILSRVSQFWIQSFPSVKSVIIPRLKNSVCSTLYPYREGE